MLGTQRVGRRAAFRLTCAAVVIAALFPLPVDSPSSSAAGSPFVRRSGSQLVLGGKPFRFTGMNVLDAVGPRGCSSSLTAPGPLEESLAAMGRGVQVVRIWFFQNLAVVDGMRDWSGLDHALAVARAHGVLFLPVLVNQWRDCDGPDGGPGTFKDTRWYEGGYARTTVAGSLVPYRDWVAEVVTRYRDDPTILAWQLVNEAEVKPYAAAKGCRAGAARTLKRFAADVSGLIKSIDPNHLVSLGTMGNGQCGAEGGEYKDVHSVRGLDLCEYHDYHRPFAAIPGDRWNGLQVRIDQCKALDKPLIIDESGIKPRAVGGLTARAAVFAAKFTARRAQGVDGELIWAWSESGPRPDRYDVGPGDPVLAVLARLSR
jgi:mannan endo-1,4-beta-mannosidase